MNLILHLPKTENGRRELQKQVAVVHAEAVSQLLQKQTCTQGQKERLLKVIQDDLKSNK